MFVCLFGKAGPWIRLVLGTALALAPLCGCANKPYAGPVIAGVETIEEQALKEVLNAPLNFVVPYPEAPYSWERAKLFFERYTTNYEQIPPAALKYFPPQQTEVLLSNAKARSDDFLYRVRKRAAGQGFYYVVDCRPRSSRVSALEADRNGRNLARFIRAGKLELSWLKR